MLSSGNLSDEYIKAGGRMVSAQCEIQPQNLAQALVFLNGPRASTILGVNLLVDCGNQLISSMKGTCRPSWVSRGRFESAEDRGRHRQFSSAWLR